MLKKSLFALAGLVVIFGTIVVIKKKQFGPKPAFAFPPEAITSAVAAAQEWEQTVHAVGTLRAHQGVTVASEGQGTVKRLAFESGARVAAGDILLELDADVERAQLASAAARAELAAINAVRARELRASRTIAQSELDAAEATQRQAVADVESLQATLEKKTVRAPFPGRTGIRLVNLGQFLDRGAPIVTLQALDPIFVDFSLPQQRIAEVRTGYLVHLALDARPGVAFEGRVTAISPQIEASTRTFRVEATLGNADEQLSPGMFASVQVIAPATKAVVAIPSTAIYYQPFGDSVFVVKETKDAAGRPVKQVEQRFVRVGEARGDFVQILTGVQPGEEIATSGLFKLSNGRSVFVDNSLAAPVSLTPRPGNS